MQRISSHWDYWVKILNFVVTSSFLFPLFCLWQHLMWAVTRSEPQELKEERGNREEKHWRGVRASINGHTHLQVRLCRGQSVSSSGGGSGGGCQWQVPVSGAGGGRGPLERGMGMGSAAGGRHRGICLLPLHLEDKQRNRGFSDRRGRAHTKSEWNTKPNHDVDMAASIPFCLSMSLLLGLICVWVRDGLRRTQPVVTIMQ